MGIRMGAMKMLGRTLQVIENDDINPLYAELFLRHGIFCYLHQKG